MSDRHKVLINRAPKRHRSITAMNFFAKPAATEAPPLPPMPTPEAIKRPPPRFLEIFTPLPAPDVNDLVASNVSTPSTQKSSLPATPASPQRELSIESTPIVSQSYFAYVPRQSKRREERHITAIVDGNATIGSIGSIGYAIPRRSATDINPSDGYIRDLELDLEEEEQSQGAPDSMRSDHSVQWAMRDRHYADTLLMSGTFGRA
jgi:hypothetical protein